MNDRSVRRTTLPVLSKAKIAAVKSLHQKKHREAQRRFIIEGWKIVEEAVDAGVRLESVLYVEERAGSSASTKLMRKIEQAAGELFAVSPKVLASVSDAVSPQGIIAVLPMPEENENAIIQRGGRSRLVLLHGINDPGNVGTIIRTCDWFGVEGVMVDRSSAEPYQPKVVRSTMGSLFHLPVIAGVDAATMLRHLRSNGYTVYSAELTGSTDLSTMSFAERSVIIIGSESHGVSEEVSRLADHRISIPRFGKAESLNAAMACGIIISRMTMGQSGKYGGR